MIIFIITISIFAAVSFIMFVVGITRHDMRLVKLDQEFNRHPNARRWRKRPVISIVSEQKLSDEELRVLKKSYRKIRIVSSEETIPTGLVLYLTAGEQLDSTVLPSAVRQFNSSRPLTYLELLPRLESAVTTGQLFRNYHRVATAPFVFMRAGLGIARISTQNPVLLDPAQKHRPPLSYTLFSWLLTWVHLSVFSYVLYLAAALFEPELFMVYISGISLWFVWAITTYPGLSIQRRIGYILLFPVSFTYFACRLFFAPFIFIRQFVPRFAVRKMLS